MLPGNVPTMSVEAASVSGWHRFTHAQMGMTTFGASGNGSALFDHFGFTADKIAERDLARVIDCSEESDQGLTAEEKDWYKDYEIPDDLMW